MPELIEAAYNMAAAYDMEAYARGKLEGIYDTIKELSRMGLLPDNQKEAGE